jgi:hypothetical protein
MVLYFCVLIVFSLHRESLKLILDDEPLPEVVLLQPLTIRGDMIVPKCALQYSKNCNVLHILHLCYSGSSFAKRTVARHGLWQTS